jgi:hypothetical protein
MITLASYTPYLIYQNEFALMIKTGTNKDILEVFCDGMFAKFPVMKQNPP